jgi:hypothetical protein
MRQGVGMVTAVLMELLHLLHSASINTDLILAHVGAGKVVCITPSSDKLLQNVSHNEFGSSKQR